MRLRFQHIHGFHPSLSFAFPLRSTSLALTRIPTHPGLHVRSGAQGCERRPQRGQNRHVLRGSRGRPFRFPLLHLPHRLWFVGILHGLLPACECLQSGCVRSHLRGPPPHEPEVGKGETTRASEATKGEVAITHSFDLPTHHHQRRRRRRRRERHRAPRGVPR